MDVRLHSSSQHHYAVNGVVGPNTRQGEDDLSQDVKECIQFFDQTIVSLEESLQEEDPSTGQVKPLAGPVQRGDGPLAFSHSPKSSILAQTPSPKDQDIIDLVHQEAHSVQQPTFSPTAPGFHRMMSAPESHPKTKSRRDQVDGLPSEYNPPSRSGSYGPGDGFSYHPPGAIPTPVLIAQKRAETDGASNRLPSSFQRGQSVESDKPHDSDPIVKQGPPTSAKPTRFPANINVVHTNKDHQNQPGANVNIHERQAQMLANLPGTSQLVMQEGSHQASEQVARNTPARSISLRDPTPDISRMEARSKLGLNRTRAMSGVISSNPGDATVDPLPAFQPSGKPLEASLPPPTEGGKDNVVRQIQVQRKPEVLRQENRTPPQSMPHSAATKSSFNPASEHKAPVSPPTGVTALEFNSYGGKSITVKPSFHSKSESATSPTSPDSRHVPLALSSPSELNTYGGKSKVMNPTSGQMMRNDLPDILKSHVDKSQTLPTKSEPLPTDLNPYGGKSRNFNPSSKSVKAPAPTPAPKPHRHTVHVAAPKPAPQASSSDHNRRSGSVFRPQGITVEFSGRGPMNASRREALRKLGLLKKS